MPTIMRNGFFQGIKASYDPLVIPDNSIWKGLNVRNDTSGVLKIREGSRSVFPSLGELPIQGMMEAFDQIIFVWDRKIYYYDPKNELSGQISDQIVAINSTQRVSLLRWTSYGKEVIYVFGGQGIYECDGTLVTHITPYEPADGEDANMLTTENLGPATARIATLRASLSQRVAISGVPESPNTVYLSSPLNISYFPVSQAIQLPDDGNKIKGLVNWYNALLIFRDNDIWAFFGTDTSDSSASLVLQDGSVGCVSTGTIKAVPNLGVAFLGPDNIYAITGVSGVENQSKAVPIGDDIANILVESINNGGYEAAAIYHNREYRLCLTNSIMDEKVFKLNLLNEPTWYIDSGPRSLDYVVFDRQLYGSYPNNGTIHIISEDILTDDILIADTYIPVSITFRRENIQPGPSRIKRIFIYILSLGKLENTGIPYYGSSFNQFMFNQSDDQSANIHEGTPQDFEVSLFVDGNEFKVDDFRLHAKKANHALIAKSEPVRVYEARIRPSLKGHYIQIKIDTKMPEQLIAVLGYGIDFQQKGRIRGIREGITNNKDW